MKQFIIPLNSVKLVLKMYRFGHKRYAVSNRGYTGLEQWK